MSPEELILEAQKDLEKGGYTTVSESLLLEAAKLGSGHAAHELGVLYIAGGKGVEPNREKSQYWLNKSLESGFEATVATDPMWFK